MGADHRRGQADPTEVVADLRAGDGGDVVVLLAMLRTILAEGLARPPAYVDGLDELGALVDGFTPALAEQVSAVARWAKADDQLGAGFLRSVLHDTPARLLHF